jgi:tetratricopeptide (TPR) repeat protein
MKTIASQLLWSTGFAAAGVIPLFMASALSFGQALSAPPAETPHVLATKPSLALIPDPHPTRGGVGSCFACDPNKPKKPAHDPPEEPLNDDSVNHPVEPHVSRALVEPLKAANDALQAKNFTEVLAKAKEAEAISPRTAYDDYIIHTMQMAAYGAQSNYAETAKAIESIIDSPYLTAASKPPLLRTLISINYQNKDYEKAINFGERAVSAGDTSHDTVQTVAQSYYLAGKYKEALTHMEALVASDERAGRKPEEKNLNLIWSCAFKTKDEAALSRVVEKLNSLYAKPQ